MSTGSAERPVAKPQGTAHRVRVIIFRVVVTLAGLFFMVAVVLMASAPWVVLQPDQDVRTELNRWFLTFCRQRGDHCGCAARPCTEAAHVDRWPRWSDAGGEP